MAGDRIKLIRNIRFESQRFRLLTIVVGCFLISVVFLVSSWPQQIIPDGVNTAESLQEKHLFSSQQSLAKAAEEAARNTQDSGVNFAVDVVETAEVAALVVDELAKDDDQGVGERQRQPVVEDAKTATKRIRPLCVVGPRADVCDLRGDVRIHVKSSTIFSVNDATTEDDSDGEVFKIRPYARKGDDLCMKKVTEYTVRAAQRAEAPECTVRHGDAGVVFSIIGYTGNVFHDFSDVIMPLFATVRRLDGRVHLLVTNSANWWLNKYDKVIGALSKHSPVDLAAVGDEVLCFPRTIVGLWSLKELIIEPEMNPDGYSTPDFTKFLRNTLALPRSAPTTLGGEPSVKPRMIIISRNRTRLLRNLPEVVVAAETVGFDVTVSEGRVSGNVAEFARLINSCDVMVAVHGAGLTNEMFLPPNGTVVQIVPWGGLQWMARADYGDPAVAMGLKYIQYDIAVEESTLKEKYPRDHAVFTRPTDLHKNGFGFIRGVLMDGQDIRVDLQRFRPVLLKALEGLVR